MTLPDFLQRCNRYIASRGVSRTWLSKRLFQDTYRLRDLAADDSTDIGVRRLERALADLEKLEKGASASRSNDRAP